MTPRRVSAVSKRGVFTADEYRNTLRPDVVSLKAYPNGQKFKQSNFWGPATLLGGTPVADGYKMKWHNIGPGQAQLRLCVAIVRGAAYLCQAYAKDSPAKDKREAAKLLLRVDLIQSGHYEYRGKL